MTSSTALSTQNLKFYQAALQPMMGGGKDRLQRHWQYINYSRYNQVVQGGGAITFIAGSAVMGGMAGAAIGGSIGTAIAKEQGGKVGVTVGFTLGFTVGAGGGVIAYIKRTENSSNFNKWVEEKEAIAIDETLLSFYERDSILKNYMCPITLSIMAKPVRTPTGHLFDMRAIQNSPTDEKNRVKCPMTRESFDINNLVVDVERGLLIHKRIYDIVYNDIQKSQENHLITKLLNNHNDQIKRVIDLCYIGILSIIEKRRLDKITSFQQCEQERADFVKIFGENSEHKLDWSQDWKDILKKRWVHFYPHIPVFDSNEV
jgi:hypothetical protein